MRIDLEGGEYLREARATFSEIEWLYEVMADWPAGGWSLGRCSSQISKSARITDHEAPFIGLILVYCLADDAPVGVARCSYLGGQKTGFQVDFAAIHPAHRGVGHFTRFSDGIAWWANQVLQADEAVYQTMEQAPQVAHRSALLGGAAAPAGRGSVGALEEVKMRKADVDRVVRGRGHSRRG